MKLTNPVPLAVGVAGLLLAAGCKSSPTTADSASSVPAGPTNAKAGTTVDPAKRRPVVVYDFIFDAGSLHPDSGLLANRQGPVKRIVGEVHPPETPDQKAARLAALLSETIAKELTAQKIPARRELRGTAVPDNALVVDGEFLQVDEGNRLRRAIVGFGAGASEVLAQVAIYDLRQSRDLPVLVYGAGTGSKPLPGAVVTLNPYAMAAKYVLSRNADEKDVRKLGKQIAKDLAQMEAQNASPP
jgi:hypothetical protein